MKKILNASKLTLPILLAVVLLAVQAQCDLALPDYMSDVVNVGIQQGGIENATPEKIRRARWNTSSCSPMRTRTS
ncbi:MAG: hypothetical protein ACLUFV_04240 [Acutalibacteraceae bacterium]